MTGHIRLRAVLVGLILGIGLCVAAPFNTAMLGNTPLGGGHFPLAPFFIAAWLFALCSLQARITNGKPALSGVEIVVIWVLMVLFSAIGWAGLAETFFVNITAPARFANDDYRWTEVLGPLLPKAWLPSDPNAVQTLYDGLDNGRAMSVSQIVSRVQWSAWLGPLGVWSLFILGSFFVMLCLMRLFGRQWVVNERVMFPLVRVPQLMGEALDSRTLGAWWANRYLLAGLLMAGSLHLLNGLHWYFPSVPELPTLVLAGKYFPKFGLFSGFHKLKIYLVPAFIGFAFLTTRQISFSMWVFYILAGLLFGLLYVLGWQLPEAALGVTFGPDLIRPERAQTIGAYLVFFLFLCWLARHHLRHVLCSAIRPLCPALEGMTPDVPQEWHPAIWPLVGLLLGLAFLVGWCLYFGLPLLAALALPGAFLVVTLVASRAVCQGGLPYFTLTAAPADALVGCFGTGFFGAAGIAATAVMQKVLFLDMREAVAPTLFHGAKGAESADNRKYLPLILGVALVLAVACAFGTMLFIGYKYGLRELNLDWATQTVLANYESAQQLVDVPSGPNRWTVIYTLAGAGIMFFLILCYYRLPWWPLHPLGYVVAYSSGMHILWFSFFLGWLCNHLCLHYGGTSLFNRVRFLFIGLILGDFLAGGAYALLGLFTGTVYSVFPL
ncbi:DUF6785 family protein [Pseudodesulfovibrio tunisiensis]|uniref:DUF6785 family protein n=1 Tax=Pseudodesulfovibrio tunisiensis TaxID=463192 RepID=UPI001FB2C4D7|nr:DUF6785 family protein [Pseudodesulfovibrio tunisiensis]